MTDAVILALIGSATTTVAAVIAAWVSVRNGRKTDALKAKTDEIQKQTNGHLSGLAEQLRTANETIANMHKSIERIAPTNR